MDNPSSDMFHKLIRRNRGSRNTDAISIMENGELHYSELTIQIDYLDTLRTWLFPKTIAMMLIFLDIYNIRHNIFDTLCKHSSNEPQFGFQNICDAIQQLRSDKATDELGLAAEYLEIRRQL